MEFSEVVRKRRSIRSFAPEIPPSDVVDRVIDTARRAPSAGFSQGLDFLVLDDPHAVATFWRLTNDPNHDVRRPAGEAPVVVLVFSDPKRYLARYSAEDKLEFQLDDLDRWPVRFWDVDGGMAAMQLQLAAVDAGLDTWFFGIGYGEDAIRSEFSIPDDRLMVGLIALGYRADDEQPTGSGTTRKRRPLEDQLHRNTW
ncbi:MAG: nitroreductase family protein [Acidimicrobiia bacterium]|nr:nitroreductase family protein [Acidimicrobiia bacterium]